jgi:predicted DCC family thiol-disulfide oxidoreductase YuxK
MSGQEILLVYDPQCPVCDAYCRAVARQGSQPGLALVDARAPSPLMDEITRRGLDIDEGMVVRVGGELHYGAEAIHALAMLGGTMSALERANRWLFGSARRARLLYPLLRAGRNLLLKALRRTRINNLRIPGQARF